MEIARTDDVFSRNSSLAANNAIVVTKKSPLPKSSKWEYVRLNASIRCGRNQRDDVNRVSQVVSAGLTEDSSSSSPSSPISESDDGCVSGRFSFTVRIFPGQVPSDVEIGWVTPTFHSDVLRGTNGYRIGRHSVRLVDRCDGDETVSIRSAYVCTLSDLHTCLGDRPLSREVAVGCILDTDRREISYCINGKGVPVCRKKVGILIYVIIYKTAYSLVGCTGHCSFSCLFLPQLGTKSRPI